MVDLTLEQTPISPHVLVFDQRPIGITDIESRGLAQHLPVPGRPGAQAPDHQITVDGPLVGDDAFDLAAPHVVAGHLDAGQDTHIMIGAFPRQPPHHLARTGIATNLLVVEHVHVLGLKIGPYALQKAARVVARVQLRLVAHGVLALVDALVVRELVGLAAGDVAHLLKSKGNRVVHPHIDAMAQNGVQWLGHVEVAHATASNTRGTRPDAPLIQHHDVSAAAPPPGFQLHSQVPGAAQTMNAGTYNNIPNRLRNLIHSVPPQKNRAPSLERGLYYITNQTILVIIYSPPK